MSSIVFSSIIWKLMTTINCLVSHIFQNIFFYVQQKKEDLDQLEGELYDDGIFIFWWTVPLTMEKFIRKILFFQMKVWNLFCHIQLFSHKVTLIIVPPSILTKYKNHVVCVPWSIDITAVKLKMPPSRKWRIHLPHTALISKLKHELACYSSS